MKDIKVQPQVLHCLLLREVCQSKFDDIWFDISDFYSRFSIREFAVVLGLKCVDDFERKKIEKSLKNNLVDKFFNGSSKVNISDIKYGFLLQILIVIRMY